MSRAVARQLQIPKKRGMEANIPKSTSQQLLQQRALAKPRPDITTSQQADQNIATRPVTRKPVTAKGAGGKGEALR